MEVRRPEHVSPQAEACLQAVADCPSARHVVLGGAFGLAHYHEFRTTRDVDAWWSEECTATDRDAVVAAVSTALERFGTVQRREHGDVVSIELRQGGPAVFSFQVARRSARLGAPVTSAWPPVPLDSFEDLVAAKMAALVARGAPRDFVDIDELCRRGLVAPGDCWDLWARRERGRGVTPPEAVAAAEAVLLHLARIERIRPLDAIDDGEERARIERVRGWFRDELCKPRLGLD